MQQRFLRDLFALFNIRNKLIIVSLVAQKRPGINWEGAKILKRDPYPFTKKVRSNSSLEMSGGGTHHETGLFLSMWNNPLPFRT